MDLKAVVLAAGFQQSNVVRARLAQASRDYASRRTRSDYYVIKFVSWSH